MIKESLEAYLQYHPGIETPNRKPLKRPVFIGAKWELRFDPDNRFRVYYRIDNQNQHVVLLAIGEKKGNRLFIGNEEADI